MKTLFTATLLLLILASAPTASAQPSIFWCTFTVNDGTAQAIHYVDNTLVHADNSSYAAVNHAWSAYVRATYSISDQNLYGRCDALTPDAPGGPDRYINSIEQSWKAARQTIIQVNWTYAPAADAPPAAPQAGSTTSTTQHRITHNAEPAQPPAPAAPPAPVHVAAPPPSAPAPAAPPVVAPGKAYHCVLYARQGTNDVRYSSGPIQTDAPVPSLNAAWKQEILATYHITNPRAYGGCQILSGLTSNRVKFVNSQEEHWRSLHAEVIHVNWTSAPGQVAASATPQTAPVQATAPPASSQTRAAAPANPAPAASAPLGADPRLAAIPSRIRGMINAEINANESGCRNDPAGSARTDCRCFAKKVMDYRIAHASEYQIVYGQADLVGHVTGWAQVPSVVAAAKQSCAK